MKKLIIILMLSIFFNSDSNAQTLVRGPYLQVNTSNSIVVRWDTDSTTDSRVYYGKNLNNLDMNEVLSDKVIKHKVKLTNLEPNTKYYYSVGDSSGILSASEEAQHFYTAPIPGPESTDPIRIWAIGDFGKGNQGQKDVRDAYLNYLGDSLRTNVWLWLGDNAYDDGNEQEYSDKVFDETIYSSILKNMPFWPCPGNHDYNSVCPIICTENPTHHEGVYYNIVSVPEDGEAGGTPSGLPLYYSFDYGNIHFISLNSEIGSSVEDYDWTGIMSTAGWNNSPMKAWLEEDLDQNEQPWVIAFWHQVPFSKGSHDSDDQWELYMKGMRENVVPLLESYDVDMILCGHSHVYERSYMIKGFYGSSGDFDSSVHVINGLSGNPDLGEEYIKNVDLVGGNNGTMYVVSGNGGSSTSNPELNHPIMAAADGGSSAYGSVVIEVSGNQLDLIYLKSDSTIGDKFSIVKKGIPTSDGGAISNPKEQSNLNQLKVFPHPFTDYANVYYSLNKETDVQVELLDITGKKISTVFEGTLPAGPQNHYINSNSLGISKGMYLVTVNDGNETKIEKIVKVE
ncbi:MAG: metallophosphoesterase [Chitinophagales bacterium]